MTNKEFDDHEKKVLSSLTAILTARERACYYANQEGWAKSGEYEEGVIDGLTEALRAFEDNYGVLVNELVSLVESQLGFVYHACKDVPLSEARNLTTVYGTPFPNKAAYDLRRKVQASADSGHEQPYQPWSLVEATLNEVGYAYIYMENGNKPAEEFWIVKQAAEPKSDPTPTHF